MPIILDTLEEPLNEITLLIQLGVEGVLYLEINFIGNANGYAVTFKVRTNFVTAVSTVCEYFFPCKVNAGKQFQSFVAVVNVSAADKHVDCLHSFIKQDMNFGIFTATRRTYILVFPI